ncbi:alpha/beta fold hydrolase [Croceicoccus ponticola]|uniref:Alpha/beta fold hydrolase n=1 Tax=Croceicoccus ponticola TaxID=2217664 RepID=A0A437H1W3_9SPHN|nr:alpha/beta fold hydrolase [Croceicoccus ponticola]RVQ69512.1 alpha/beta fold hydrolase [Croceicoccus ponticola]
MTAPLMTYVTAADGTRLAVHRLGAGKPIVLLHGLFSSAEVNWIKFGTAQKLADAGFDVIMPDLRAHGMSDAPHDSYGAGVLVSDLEDVLAHFGLRQFDLAGFSLGARTALNAVLAGVTPERLALVGMGWEGLVDWDKRIAFFIDAIDRYDDIRMGDPAFFAKSFMKTQKVDRVAMRALLLSMTGTDLSNLDAVRMPTRVINGDKDHDNGSAQTLVQKLPNATFAEIPGTHMSCVSEPALGDELVRFFAG